MAEQERSKILEPTEKGFESFKETLTKISVIILSQCPSEPTTEEVKIIADGTTSLLIAMIKFLSELHDEDTKKVDDPVFQTARGIIICFLEDMSNRIGGFDFDASSEKISITEFHVAQAIIEFNRKQSKLLTA